MSTIRIESLGKDITFLPYTHRIAKAEKEALLAGVIVGTSQDLSGGAPSVNLPVTNQIQSEEIRVLGVTGLLKAELDSVLEEEYAEILEAVNKFVEAKKK